MLNHLWVTTLADENFSAVLFLSLTGFDGSMWLMSKPIFAHLAEVLALT